MLHKRIIGGCLAATLATLLLCDGSSPTKPDEGSDRGWTLTNNTLTDPDGTTYTTVLIGNQLWTVQNLQTTRYRDGAAIAHLSDSAGWTGATGGGYCYYDNDVANATRYGALYNWHAVNTGKLAPAGWRIPDTTDWNTLRDYLIDNGYNHEFALAGSNAVGKALASQDDWAHDDRIGRIGNDPSSNNSSGFTGQPGGSRHYFRGFREQGEIGRWWSLTQGSVPNEACARYLQNGGRGLSQGDYDVRNGFSVRLVRDVH